MSPHSAPPVETGADDIQAHPRHTGVRWFDLILALSAIFISAVSLAVAIEHGRTERDLVAANSWPFLREIRSNESSTDADSDVEIGLSNGGVGPAKVESFEVLYKGHPVASGLDLLRRCCGLAPGDAAVARQLPQGLRFSIVDHTVVRPGENNVVFRINRGSAHELPDRLSAALGNVSFHACYCSILDQCWTSTLQDTHTTAVKACPEPKQRFDPNGR